jgi:hypothetical protein
VSIAPELESTVRQREMGGGSVRGGSCTTSTGREIASLDCLDAPATDVS